jgi:hypothetical protein
VRVLFLVSKNRIVLIPELYVCLLGLSCTEAHLLCQRYDVSGYPTIVLFRADGVMFRPSHGTARTLEGMSQFALTSLKRSIDQGQPTPIPTSLDLLNEFAQQVLVDVYNEYTDRPTSTLSLFALTCVLTAITTFTIAMFTSGRK